MTTRNSSRRFYSRRQVALGLCASVALGLGAPAALAQGGAPGTAGAAPPAGGAAGSAEPLPPPAAMPSSPPGPAPADARPTPDPTRPPPLNVEYAQYGVALVAEMNLSPGAACRASDEGEQTPSPDDAAEDPCIIGSGGGLVIRGGYRSPGPWYFGGAYEFIKMDSGNLYRLGIFQQLRAEMRYLPETGYRVAPYATWGLGAVAYGNEWGVETGGALVFGGGGIEFEVSRTAMLGLNFVYRPVLIAGWTDGANFKRDTAIAHFLSLDLLLEIRTELNRR